MSGEPAFYFAEDLLKKFEASATASKERLLSGQCETFDAYKAASARLRAIEECSELVRQTLAAMVDQPLAEIEKRVTGQR